MSNVDLLNDVTEKLNRYFDAAGFGLKAEQMYLTAMVKVQHTGEEVIGYSQTVAWAIMERVQENEPPQYDAEHVGIFTHQWTFDPAYRVDESQLNLDQLNGIGREIVESYNGL
ncbi:hypothetical protein SAMN04487857_10190 [Pseudomonas sp. ok272]|uniref:hypothetical protein n=1 Tax=unclassified Pseudomonas TaxID=196821 RepID=UPI0008AB3C5E|nr:MULTISPECIES: hypothetical protein [unclassified Pseudomonas]SEM31407.1 hypothetical protein SAMN04487857_10190 [Pseudomonas sp. ok272]SFM31408.1 hypothetical protein SAMN04487858_10290 [Pseudomonas sp. ok602]